MMNGTVSSIVSEANNTYFTTTDVDGKQYLSKKIILATGMKDLLPTTPGLAAGWGKGIYCTYSKTLTLTPHQQQQGVHGATAGNTATSPLRT